MLLQPGQVWILEITQTKNQRALSHDIRSLIQIKRADCSLQEGSEEWNSKKAHCLLLQQFFIFVYVRVWLAGLAGLLAGEERASLSRFSQSVCPACRPPQTQHYEEAYEALGPRGKRLCVSVINLLMPTPRQQEIADFSSFTRGPERRTRWAALRVSWWWIDSLRLSGCAPRQSWTCTARPPVSSTLE